MSIKSFAYQLSLKSNNAISRSQCYELFAAAHGYKSYAAIDCVVDMPEYHTPKVHTPKIDNELLSERASALRLNPALVCNWVAEVMKGHSLKPFTFLQLADHVGWIVIPDIQPFVEALQPHAQRGNGMAHYCLGLLYGIRLSDNPENKQLSKAHLNAAADLGNLSAMVRLALRHDDPRVLDCKADLLTNEISLPWGVEEIAEYALSKGRKDEYLRWLTYGCALGEMHSIFDLALALSLENRGAALALVKFASLLGTDLTKPQTREVNERGDDYDDQSDDDLFIEETEGVKIENVTASEDTHAARLANEWFRQYEEKGRANILII